MSTFLKRLGLILMLLFLIDRAFKLLDYKDRNIFNDITRAKMIQVAHEKPEWDKMEMMVIGSSHGQFGISPEILADSLKLDCVSFAYGVGSNTGRQLSILKKLTNELNHVKVIIWNFDVYTLNDEPYDTDEFQNLLFAETGRPKLLRYSNTYKYFNNLKRYYADIKTGNYQPPYLRNKDNYEMSMFKSYTGYSISKYGWARGEGQLNPTYIRFSDVVFKPNAKSIFAMDEIVKICKSKKIQLIITQVPESAAALKYHKKYEEFDNWIRPYCLQNGVEYLNYDDEKYYPVSDNANFFDSDHLNRKGAELFSSILAKDVKKIITGKRE